MKKSFVITSPDVRCRVMDAIGALPLEPKYKVTIQEVKSLRNLEQNAKMWAMLTDIAEQLDWYGQKLSKEDWKDVFTAALKRLKVVPGIDGGFVVIGAHTSKMSIAEMAELIEFAMAFVCQHGVRWKDYEI